MAERELDISSSSEGVMRDLSLERVWLFRMVELSVC